MREQEELSGAEILAICRAWEPCAGAGISTVPSGRCRMCSRMTTVSRPAGNTSPVSIGSYWSGSRMTGARGSTGSGTASRAWTAIPSIAATGSAGTDHRECTASAVTPPTASSTATISVGSSLWQPALVHAASQAASAAWTFRSPGSAMHGRRRGDPLGAGVDVHGGAAEETDEGDAGFLSEVDGE